jgi:hypothetical protein
MSAMFTWTFNHNSQRGKVLSALAVVLALSGCFEGDGFIPEFNRRDDATRSLSVAGGLIIAGPAHFCIDTTNTRNRGEGAFVLLGGCDVVAGAHRGPRDHAILSASVAQVAEPPSAEDYAGFFATPEGRALLSRAGDAGSVEIRDSTISNGVLFLRVQDTSDNEGPRLSADHWRAVLGQSGHMVMLSVLSRADDPLGAAVSRVILDSFVAAVRRANPN